jgi:hypothetical protein
VEPTLTAGAPTARRSRLVSAIVVSIGLHGVVAFSGLAMSVLRGMVDKPSIQIEFSPIDSKPPEVLPLGLPPKPAAPKDEPGVPVPRPRRPIAKAGVSPDAGVPPVDAAPLPEVVDAGRVAVDSGGAPGDAGAAVSLREAGPEGSRLVALLRLDRLRAPTGAPLIPLVDRLLQMLPDRRRLLQGAQIDLYHDFDSLLIATPNPMDDAVTFLAVRHHLAETRLKEGLASASAGSRPIEWRSVRDRPVGLRADPSGKNRDNRIFVLPTANLAVIAAPAYADLLLGNSKTDAGATDWQMLTAQLDAQMDAVPPDAIFVLTASNLFPESARQARPGTAPLAAFGGALVQASAVELVVRIDSVVRFAIKADFVSPAFAEDFARKLGPVRKELLGNPFVMLAGLGAVAGSLSSQVQGSSATVTLQATRAQLEAIFGLVANLTKR